MIINYWEGLHVRLRAFEEKDAEMYAANRHTPDGVRQFYEDYIRFPDSLDDVKKDVAKIKEDFSTDDKRVFVIETIDCVYIGEISIWFTDRVSRCFRYGIFLDNEFRGRGLAKEALVIVMDYYFNQLNYHKCSPTVYSFNKNSQKFHERFGFVLEGKLREEVYARGEYHDMYYYGMLKSEFNKKYKHFPIL